MICNECETVAHCSKHGCIPKHQALEKMAENARELGLDYEQYKDAIEVSVIFHEGQRMFAVPKQVAQQEPVGEVNRYGLDSHGRKWHGIYWYDPNVDVPHGTKLYTSPPAQQEPWGFHIQFNNGKDATFKGLDYLADCEAHLEAGETITKLYIKEST